MEIVPILIAIVIGYILLFFVIKGAIKSALMENKNEKNKSLNSEYFGVKNIREK